MSGSNMKQQTEFIKSQLRSAREEANSVHITHKVDTMEERLLVCELMTQTLCNLMEKKGISRDEIMEELTKTMEARDKYKYQVYNRKCDKCNRKMQQTPNNPILYRCMYCNATFPVYPYLRYEEQPQLEEIEEPVQEAPKEPYNLDKDLGFDDLNYN